MHPQTLKWDFFLAHSSADSELVEELYYHLLKDGMRVFLDKQHLVPGMSWDTRLPEEQRNSIITVILISEHTPAAHYQREEITHAIQLTREKEVFHRIVPVYVGDSDTSIVPYGLRNTQSIVVRYIGMREVAQQLCGILNWIKKEELNIATIRNQQEPNSTAEPNPVYFAAPIRKAFLEMGRAVDVLTQEQLRVIEILSDVRRVRIRGCPGSGKTLIAIEKAIRLARAGLQTLFLCHNPLLANYVSKLSSGSGVQVYSFGTWIAAIVNNADSAAENKWSHFEEPDEDTLGTAFDLLCVRGPQYDAIIVDEGQDFREAWWALVEAGQRSQGAGILYIFHDDSQALLPFRASYPIEEPVLNLSRNCRNAGAIYDLMRFFDSNAPATSPSLKDTGIVRSHVCKPGMEREAIGRTVRDLVLDGLTDITILVGGGWSIDTFTACGLAIAIPTHPRWQEIVSEKLLRRLLSSDLRGVAVLSEDIAWATQALNKLSDHAAPTDSDVTLVCEVARRFSVQTSIRRRILDSRFREAFTWVAKDRTLDLRRFAHGPLWAAELILFFEQPEWAAGIPQPEIWTIRPYYAPYAPRTVKVYDVSNYKGLESDAVILAFKGKAPLMSQQVYVGISRAKFMLELIFDPLAASTLPFPLDQSG